MDHPSESESVASPPPDTPYSFSNKVFEQFNSSNSNTTTISALSNPIVTFRKSPNEAEDTASVVTMRDIGEQGVAQAGGGGGRVGGRYAGVRKLLSYTVMCLIWAGLFGIVIHYAIKTAYHGAPQDRCINDTGKDHQLAQPPTTRLTVNATPDYWLQFASFMKAEYAGMQRLLEQSERHNDTLNKQLNLTHTALSNCQGQLQQMWTKLVRMVDQQMYQDMGPAGMHPCALHAELNATAHERLQAQEAELARKETILHDLQDGLMAMQEQMHQQTYQLGMQSYELNEHAEANATAHERLQAQAAELARKEERIRQLEAQAEEQERATMHSFKSLNNVFEARVDELKAKDVQLGKLQERLEMNQRELNQSISTIGVLEGKVKECQKQQAQLALSMHLRAPIGGPAVIPVLRAAPPPAEKKTKNHL